MFTEPMHGPVAQLIFWIWLGFIAVGAVAYLAFRLLRPRLSKAKTPPPPTMKYAEQLRHRLRKKPPPAGTAAPDSARAVPKPPSTTK